MTCTVLGTVHTWRIRYWAPYIHGIWSWAPYIHGVYGTGHRTYMAKRFSAPYMAYTVLGTHRTYMTYTVHAWPYETLPPLSLTLVVHECASVGPAVHRAIILCRVTSEPEAGRRSNGLKWLGDPRPGRPPTRILLLLGHLLVVTTISLMCSAFSSEMSNWACQLRAAGSGQVHSVFFWDVHSFKWAAGVMGCNVRCACRPCKWLSPASFTSPLSLSHCHSLTVSTLTLSLRSMCWSLSYLLMVVPRKHISILLSTHGVPHIHNIRLMMVPRIAYYSRCTTHILIYSIWLMMVPRIAYYSQYNRGILPNHGNTTPSI